MLTSYLRAGFTQQVAGSVSGELDLDQSKGGSSWGSGLKQQEGPEGPRKHSSKEADREGSPSVGTWTEAGDSGSQGLQLPLPVQGLPMPKIVWKNA